MCIVEGEYDNTDLLGYTTAAISYHCLTLKVLWVSTARQLPLYQFIFYCNCSVIVVVLLCLHVLYGNYMVTL